MRALTTLHASLVAQLDRMATPVLGSLARFSFAAVLLVYFWKSALTKLGPGPQGLLFPSDGAYAQVFPRAMEAVSYDSAQLGPFYWATVVLGTWAEFLLPALIVIGLFARLSALGMIGFVILQSATDVFGHAMSDPATLGAWFDKAPDSAVIDQRLLWITLLAVIVFKGAGPLSADRLLARRS